MGYYSTEFLLVALAAGLYLFDAIVLLHADEGLLVHGGRDRWWATLAPDHLVLGGRNIYVPNPLRPHESIYRLGWQFDGGVAAPADTRWTDSSAVLAGLRLPLWSLGTALFVLLPLGLFTPLGYRMSLAALAVLYGSLLALIVVLARARNALGMSRARFASLAVESILCPPFALNLARKLALRIDVDEDLLSASRRLLDRAGWNALRIACMRRLEDALRIEPADSPRKAALEAHLARLAAESEELPLVQQS